jgi:hypothetical protein
LYLWIFIPFLAKLPSVFLHGDIGASTAGQKCASKTLGLRAADWLAGALEAAFPGPAPDDIPFCDEAEAQPQLQHISETRFIVLKWITHGTPLFEYWR